MRSSLEKELGGCEGRRYCGQEAMCVSLMCPSFEVWSPVSPFTASYLVPPSIVSGSYRQAEWSRYVEIIYSINTNGPLYIYINDSILTTITRVCCKVCGASGGLRFFCIRNRTTCLAVSWPISPDPKPGTPYHRPNISGFNPRCACGLLPSTFAASVVWLAPSSFAAF